MATSSSQLLSPDYERYPESYQAVEFFKTYPDFKDVLIDYILVVAIQNNEYERPPGDPTGPTKHSGWQISYYTYLVTKPADKTCLRLEMTETSGSGEGSSSAKPHRGILKINREKRVTVEKYEKLEKTAFTKRIYLHPTVRDTFTVKDYMSFLLDKGLLRYSSDYPTHSCFWHFWLLSRQAEEKIIVEQSSTHLLEDMEARNKVLKAKVDAGDRTILVIDVDNITKRRGTFE